MIIQGDSLNVLKTLPSESVQCCVTSPPYYGLRDYGVDGQIGLEETPEQYIENLVAVFREVRRVLKDDGTLWVNIGDSYYHTTSNNGGYSEKSTLSGFSRPDTKGRIANETGKSVKLNMNGIKQKDLIGIPWMLAFALRSDGWYLRQDIIWAKPNPMPESVLDRCTKSHEYIFLLSKSSDYFFNHSAMQEEAVCTSEQGRVHAGRFGGNKYTELPDVFYRTKSGNAYNYTGFRNKRDVWTVCTKPYSGAHFATFPEQLIKPCILAGSNEGDTVLDPFNGAATTGVVCMKHKRNYIGIELNPEYVELSEKRLQETEAEYGVEINQVCMF